MKYGEKKRKRDIGISNFFIVEKKKKIIIMNEQLEQQKRNIKEV